MKAPAFQFYAADFIVGVMGLSDEDVGVYIKMLSFQWERGSLPADPKAIKSIVNSRKIPSDFLLGKFPVSADGLRRNPRLEKEREKQAKFRESRAENANKRWQKGCTSNARASSVHDRSISKKDALQSSSSSTEYKAGSPPFGSEVFKETWATWKAYLRSKGKPMNEITEAQQWRELKPLGEARAIAMIGHTISRGWMNLREKGKDDDSGSGDRKSEGRGW